MSRATQLSYSRHGTAKATFTEPQARLRCSSLHRTRRVLTTDTKATKKRAMLLVASSCPLFFLFPTAFTLESSPIVHSQLQVLFLRRQEHAHGPGQSRCHPERVHAVAACFGGLTRSLPRCCDPGQTRAIRSLGPVYEDILPGYGQLSGIHAALSNSQTPFNLIIAVDTLFLAPEFSPTWRAGPSNPGPSLPYRRSTTTPSRYARCTRWTSAPSRNGRYAQGNYKIFRSFPEGHS